MEQAGGERVTLHLVGNPRSHVGWRAARVFIRLLELKPNGVPHQERQAGDRHYPNQGKRNVDGDVLAPRAGRPNDYAHFASSTPRIARLTRLRMSGIL